MNRQQLEHALRAAGRIIDEKSFIVIGSQSILGSYPDAPPDFLYSMEVDLIPKTNAARTHELEEIGEDSKFFEIHGFYVDPVDNSTAILPRSWKNRLVNVQNENTNGVLGLCLHPADLFIAKAAAGREKDIEFIAAMIEHNMVDRERVCLYASTIPNPANDTMRSRRTMARIDRLFEAHSPSVTKEVNEQSGRYVGNVLCMGETYIRQDLGRGETVMHLVDKLNRLPPVGKPVAIDYRDGRGYVSSKERGQAVER